MRIACLAERRNGERRVALTPETAGKLAKLGAEVAVEAGAGTGASIPDTAYAEAGAAVGSAAETAAGAGIVLAIEAPDPALLSNADEGAKVLALFDPHDATGRLRAYAEAGLEALAMELLPRITRAQSMDVLSSQSNLAGYVAVLAAANEYGRAFPMMMTAAGTVSPARVFVMGVGVAGLQAIATAKRLGAQVSATDVRSATREQIESLGAKPVFVDDVAGIEGEGSGGYAGEMSAEYRAAQAELVSAHLAKQDIVITTALIPGKPAPRLVSDAQLATMRPGSVLYDLAVARGGNVEGAPADGAVRRHGVTVMGDASPANRVPADASALFARNLSNFVTAFWDGEKGRLAIDDEIGDAIQLTRDGRIVHPDFVAAQELASAI